MIFGGWRLAAPKVGEESLILILSGILDSPKQTPKGLGEQVQHLPAEAGLRPE